MAVRRAVSVARFTLALVFLLGGMGALSAQEPTDAAEDGERVYEIDDTVVTGTRTKRRLRDTPVKTELVRAERIEAKGATSLVEALAFEPGIRIDNQCSICNTTQVKLSGLPGRYTLMLIDGMPIYSSLGQTYGLLNVSAADIAQLEVVKGAASVLYGSDAMGGVVNVITKRPGKKPRASIGFEAGDFGYTKLNGSASLRTGDLGLSIVGSLSSHDKIDRDDDGISEYTGYDRAYVATTAHWDIADDVTLLMRGAFSQEARQGGGSGSILEVMDDDDGRRGLSETILTRRMEGGLKLDWEVLDNLRLETTAAVTYHHQDSDYEGEVYVGEQLMVYAQEAFYADLASSYSLLGGIAYRMENLEENLALSEYTYHMPGIFLEGDWRPTSWMEFVHGVRWDYHNEFGNVFTPHAALKFQPLREFTIRARGGMGFRAPSTFYEYAHGVRPDGYTLVNDADDPERSISAGLSLTYDAGRLLQATLSGSYNRVMDPITIDAHSSTGDELADTVRVYNVDEALSVISVEAQVQSQPLKWLRGSLGYGYYNYDDPAGALVSAPPEHQITVGLDFMVESIGFTASLNAEITGPMDLEKVYGASYNAKPGTTLTGWLDTANADLGSLKRKTSPWYALLSARVEQKVYGGLSVYLGVDNLLDYHQADDESPLHFPVADDGSADPADVVHIWGPMRGRFIYGGLRLDI